jgi:hypothetical protein
MKRLAQHSWIVRPEVSFSVYGERGSIDVLAFHPVSRVLLTAEVKTSFGDIQQTLSAIDRKGRLGPQIARGQGWDPVAVSVLLAVADTTTNRRTVAAHARTFAAAFPFRGRGAARQLRGPAASAWRGLVFLPPSRGTTRTRAPRISAPKLQAAHAVATHENERGRRVVQSNLPLTVTG